MPSNIIVGPLTARVNPAETGKNRPPFHHSNPGGCRFTPNAAAVSLRFVFEAGARNR
jgi:hypothetical protein